MAAHEVLEGLEYLGSVACVLLGHGDLLTCSARCAALVGRPPRSVTGPESLAVTCTASTFGADVERPLSRVASPERYVGLRVSRGELLLRRPLDCYNGDSGAPVQTAYSVVMRHTTGPAKRGDGRLRDRATRYSSSRIGQRGGRTRRAGSSRPRWTIGDGVPVEQPGVGVDEAQPDPPFPHGRESCRWSRMPTCSSPSHNSEPSRSGWRPSATMPRRRRPVRSPSPLPAQPPGEIPFVPADDPAQAGLQRGDAGVPARARGAAVPLRAAGCHAPPAGRGDALTPARPPRNRRHLPDRTFHALLAGVSGAGHQARHPAHSKRHGEPVDRGGLRPRLRHRRPRLGALHGDHRPLVGDVVPPMAAMTSVVFEALGITSNRSSSTHHTMMSSTTNPSSSRRCVYWARPGWIRRQIVAQRALQVLEGDRTADAHRAQVADVEGDRRSRQARCSPPSRTGTPTASPSPRTEPSWRRAQVRRIQRRDPEWPPRRCRRLGSPARLGGSRRRAGRGTP
jgi:hypothetical protein